MNVSPGGKAPAVMLRKSSTTCWGGRRDDVSSGGKLKNSSADATAVTLGDYLSSQLYSKRIRLHAVRRDGIGSLDFTPLKSHWRYFS